MVDVQRSGGVNRTDCYHFRFTHGTPHPPQHSYQFVRFLFGKKFLTGCSSVVEIIDRLESLSGWRSLVNSFPQEEIHVSTIASSLFDSCYPIHMSIKTDYEGVILPPALKLNPLRYKVQLRDCREHRRHTLFFELVQTDWNHVCEAENIDEAVTGLTRLQTKIPGLINDCMPFRTVKMSSRDPFWMSPLTKYCIC